MYDVDDVSAPGEHLVTAIEEVKSAVEEVTRAVEKVQHAVESKESGSRTLFLWIFFASLWILIPSWLDSAWHSKYRYSFQYDLPEEKITIESKPHDCNFFAAPLGAKYCEYERRVQVIYWSTSTTGAPIVSVDSGKTWSTFTPDAGVSVPPYRTAQSLYVTWEKKTD